MLIEHSKNESITLQLNIGRCNTNQFDVSQFKKELIAGSFDLCRVKVDAKDEGVVKRLENIGFPYFFSGSIRRYKTPINLKESLEFKNEGLTFVSFEPELEDLLFRMLKDTWGDYPIGYYRSPILDGLISKDLEITSVFNFYKEQNNPLLHPQNSIQFIKHQGEFVGFFALNKVETHLESHIGGILSDYQGKDYFYDMLVYIKNYCKQEGLSHFMFGARNENSKVQKIFQNAGFIPIGTENVFHVLSLLNHVKKQGAIITELNQKNRLKQFLMTDPSQFKLYVFKNSALPKECRTWTIKSGNNSKISFCYAYEELSFCGGEISVANKA